jgi:hypothetical protein
MPDTSPEFQLQPEQLFSQSLHDAVINEDLYKDIIELQINPDENAERISNDVKELRKKLGENDRFRFLEINICTTQEELEQARKTMEAEHERMKAEDGIFYGRYGINYEFPNYSMVLPVELKNLYHWSSAKNANQIEAHGLLPGFVTSGRNTRGFVHTTATFDEHWPQKVAQELNHTYNPQDYTAYEIDYDPSLEAYMWLQVIHHEPNGNIPLLTSYHSAEKPGLSCLVSSRAVPLSLQVGELVEYDREVVEHADSNDKTNWRYSSLLGMHLHPNAASLPENYSTSEILLDYVPPSRIKRLK